MYPHLLCAGEDHSPQEHLPAGASLWHPVPSTAFSPFPLSTAQASSAASHPNQAVAKTSAKDQQTFQAPENVQQTFRASANRQELLC